MPKLEANQSSRELVPAWTHLAYLYSIVDLGTQPGSVRFPEAKRQLEFTYELVGELRDFNGEEKPMVISQKVTLPRVLNEKSNLYKIMLQLNGGKALTAGQLSYFDTEEWIGKPCTVTVTHSEDGRYANVLSVGSIAKGITMPAQFNPNFFFDLDKFDADKLERLPEWKKEKIKSSPEYMNLLNSTIEFGDDDLPFN